MKTLTAYYDLAVGPASFDVIAFLVQARQAAGSRPLHVVIVPDESGVGGQFRDKTALYDVEEMRWRLWNIVIPACQLVGATVHLAASRQQAWDAPAADRWPADWNKQTLRNRHHMATPLIAAGRRGVTPPRISASKHALRKVGELYAALRKPVITLTLRSTYDVARNSVTTEWRQLCDALEADGYAVVCLQDTDAALSSGAGFGELNLDLRMACYQLARQNVIGLNGPAVLLWYSDAPMAMFDAPVHGDAEFNAWRDLGMNTGDQLPWATAQQEIFYQRANKANMRAGLKHLGI